MKYLALLLLLIPLSLFGQVESQFNGTLNVFSASRIGSTNTFTISGIFSSTTSSYTSVNSAIGDIVQVQSGSRFYWLHIYSIAGNSGGVITGNVRDSSSTLTVFPTGKWSIFRPTPNLRLPLSPDGETNASRSATFNTLALRVDEIQTSVASATNCELTITKTNHGFRKWTPVYWTGSTYVRPPYDSLVPDYIVVDSLTANTFKVATCGTYTTTLTNGLYWFTSASPGYSLTPDTTKVPLFQALNGKLILNPIVGFNLMSGGGAGDVTRDELADSTAAIRADFPSGVSDGDKGDITVLGATWSIDNGVVTSAKVASQTLDSTDLKNRGITLLKLAQSGATNGQVPKYNSTTGNWEPGADNNSGGTQLATPALSISVLSESELSLSWTAVTGADKYILERSASAGFTTPYVMYEGGLNYWINRGLPASTTYYYRVRAEAIGYNTSNNSTAVNATTQAAFNPNLSGQVVFWDITDTTTTRISGEISAINDQGSGNNDVPDLTPNRPNYFSTGGPQNYPYVRTTTAEPLGVTTFSETTTPLTVYAVVRLNDFTSLGYTVFEYNTLPSPGQTNSNGVKVRLNSSNRIAVGARGYTQTGQGAYYGAPVSAMYRKEWMVLKIVFKDNNSHWIEINDEPIQFPKDSTGGAALAITRFLFYNCDIAQVRGFNRLMTTDEDRKMKKYLIRHFGIVKPKVLGMHFGDSQTAGGGNTPRTYGPWVTIVQDNSPSVFYNLGISGTRVDNSFDTLSLKYAKPEYSDMWVTIQYGTNDAQQWAGDWENWKNLYKSIIQRFLDAGFKKEKIILLTLPYSSLTSYFGDRQPFPLAKTQEIAKEMGVSFFDWNSEMKKIGSDVGTEPSTDGIHVGTSGNLVAARGVLNILRSNTEEGMVPPQMDSVARKAIVFPQYGSLVQDTTADALYVYTGTWKKVTTATASGIQQVLLDGNTTNLTQKFQQAVPVLNDTLDISKDGLFFKPDTATYNYRIWESNSIKRQIATEGSWYEGIQRINNAGQPNPNVFLHRGYNISPTNTRLLTDVPAFSETWASNTRTSGEATGVRRIEKYFTVFGRNGSSYKPETWSWSVTNPGILGLTHEIVSPLNYFSFPSNGNIFAGINKTTGVATFDLKSSVYASSTALSLSVDSATNTALFNFTNLPELRFSGITKVGFGSGNKIVFNDLNTTAYISFASGTTFLLPTAVQTGTVYASTGGTFGHGAAPIAFLDIGGGTTTTAPIRMINGVFRTTIQNGAIEYVSPEWYGSSNGVRRMFLRPFDGTGSPEGVITAAVGATYINNSGGATTQYVKISGSGNTGWAVKYMTGSPLVLPAGTATASTAPLKFTSGTNLTTAEAGAVEYDGTEFYATNSTASRTILARVLKGSATLDFPDTASGSSSSLTITVTGAATTDSGVSVQRDNASISGTMYEWVITGANTVTVYFHNFSGSNQNPASGTFRATVTK